MGKVFNQYTTESFRPSQYEKTEDGFLRVTARVLAERVMPYLPSELSEVPEELQSLPAINMVVTRDTMSTADAMRTLEGAQVVAPSHIWVEPSNAGVSKGHAAGAARIDGPYAVIDLVITDPATIASIEAGEIGEISAGYHAESVFENGDFDGVPYHARQCQLRFNHVAILPYGEGRAGTDVRIINHKPVINIQEEPKMSMVRIKLANTGKFINVAEEDAPAVEAEQTAAEGKVGEAKAESGKTLEKLMSEVAELNAQISELTASADESKGELSVYKEKLDELLSDEAAEAGIEGQVSESADADEIIENACAGMDEKKAEEIKNSFQRIGNTGIHKLRGTALQTAVLNAVGMTVENMSVGELKGAFKTHLQFANSGKAARAAGANTQKTVAGANLFQNGANDNGKTIIQNRVAKLWGKKA